MLQRILVWDIPTRVFHWSLALSFAGAYLTAESERYRDIHVMLGYALLGLLIFRLVWGFAGSRYARFSSFLYGPKQVLGYLRSLLTPNPEHHVGHNPAGSWAIFLLLGLGLLASVSGILLFNEVGGEDAFEELHEVAANLMLAVVVVHIAGVVVSSLLHRENLLRSMVTGYKTGEADAGIRASFAWLGAIMAVAIGAFLAYYQSTVPSGTAAEQQQTQLQEED